MPNPFEQPNPFDSAQGDMPGDLKPETPKSSLTPEVSSGAEMAGGDADAQGKKDAPLTPEQEGGLKEMVSLLSRGHIDAVLKIAEYFHLPEEVLSKPEARTAAEKGMVFALSHSYINNALKIAEYFHLPEEVLSKPEVRTAAEKGLAFEFSLGHIDRTLDLADRFSLPEETVRKIARSSVKHLIEYRLFHDASRVAEQVGFSEEDIRFMAAKAHSKQKGTGLMGIARQIQKRFRLSKKERMAAAEELVAEYIVDRTPAGYVHEVINSLGLSEKVVRRSASRALETLLNRNERFDESGLIERYGLNTDDVHAAVKRTVVSLLEGGRQDKAHRLARKYELPEEVMNSPEMRNAIQRGTPERF